MNFKSDKVHKVEYLRGGGFFYQCQHAIGSLSLRQLWFKTNFFKLRRVTCANCKRAK